MLLNVPFYSQSNRLNCAPASVRAVLDFYGTKISEEELASLMKTTKNEGTPPPFLIKAVKELGFDIQFIHKEPLENEFEQLKQSLNKGIPVIVSLNMNQYKKFISELTENTSWKGKDFYYHYVVVSGFDDKYIYINDNYEKNEEEGRIILSNEIFLNAWYNERLFGDMFIIQRIE